MDTKKSEPAVAREVAEEEFARFVELNDLTFDTQRMSPDTREEFEDRRARFVLAVQRGRLVVEDDGSAKFTPKSGDGTPLTFRQPRGGDLQQLDNFRGDQTQKKAQALYALMTGTSISRVQSLLISDLTVCEAIASLFFGSR